MLRFCLVSLWMVWATGIFAQDSLEGSVRTDLDIESPHWVGLGARLYIEMLSTGFIFSNQKYTVPEMAGALVMQSSSSAVNLTERQGDETWQVLRYTMQVYPQRAGEIVVPPIDVSFSVSGGFGQKEQEFSFRTEELRFESVAPPGADPAIPVVTTDDFELAQAWVPEPVNIMAGHAIKRSITMNAEDIPGMVLPPLPVADIEGIAIYAAEPRVSTSSNRGQLSGERTEEADFVFERPGDYEIPGSYIQWWRPSREELTLVEIESLTLQVAPNPALEAGAEEAAAVPLNPARYGWWMLILVMLAALAYRIGPGVLQWFKNWQKRRADSEPSHFRRVVEACNSNNASDTYVMLNKWLASVMDGRQPSTLSGFAAEVADPSLVGELERLQQAIADGDSNWSGHTLIKSLTTARRDLKLGVGATPGLLPPLNPTDADSGLV